MDNIGAVNCIQVFVAPQITEIRWSLEQMNNQLAPLVYYWNVLCNTVIYLNTARESLK